MLFRSQQSEAVKKSRQKMYEEAAAGDPEVQVRYERHLAARREETDRGRKRPSQLTQMQKTPGTIIVRGVFIVTVVPVNPYTSAALFLEFPAQT